jgi:WhiB family redox-sensing transcriptional regulator
VLAILVEIEVGQCHRADLQDIVITNYELQASSASSLVSEALQAFRYSRHDPRGPLIFLHGSVIGLRRDLLFLPVETKEPEPAKIIPVSKAPKPKPIRVREDTVRIREQSTTNQLFAAWWPYYSPASPSHNVTQTLNDHNKELDGQLVISLQDEEPTGQRLLDIYLGDVPEHLTVDKEPDSIPEAIPVIIDQLQLDYNATPSLDTVDKPMLEVKKDLEEAAAITERISIFRTADIFTQAAMTAAFDYFFLGGEIPLVTDVATYNAFQRAFQEIGGCDSTEISGPIIKLYFGKDEIRMTSAMRQRILALGESIHGERPREVSMRTATPSLALSNAPKGWMRDGACQGLDPDIFYPDKEADENSPDLQAAKAVCYQCNVLNECLGYALDTRQKDGVWGGLTERERRVLIRRRQRQALKD